MAGIESARRPPEVSIHIEAARSRSRAYSLRQIVHRLVDLGVPSDTFSRFVESLYPKTYHHNPYPYIDVGW